MRGHHPTSRHMPISPAKRLWQAVIYRALIDAHYTGGNKDALREHRIADEWFRFGGRDFREVCALAGQDPDFVREAYINGRIDMRLLRSAEAYDNSN